MYWSGIGKSILKGELDRIYADFEHQPGLTATSATHFYSRNITLYLLPTAFSSSITIGRRLLSITGGGHWHGWTDGMVRRISLRKRGRGGQADFFPRGVFQRRSLAEARRVVD